MKRTISTGIAIAALLGIAGTASAADMARQMPVKAPAYVAPYYNWTGFYAGINGGGGWGSTGNIDTSGGIFGGQLGYNWQSGQAVFGIETDLQWTGIDGSGTVGAVAVRGGSDWFGTVRGRIGYAWDRTLIYGTGGLAYGGSKLETAGLTETHSHFGWTVGLGAEVALTQHWSAKVEYLFVKLSDERFAATGLDHDFENNLLRFGFNYRF